MFSRNYLCLLVSIIIISFVSISQTLSQDLVAINKEIGEAINAHDVDKLLTYFADDAIYEFVPLQLPITTKEEMKKFFEDLFKAFPDYKTVSEHAIFSGNIVVTEHVTTGTHLGEWIGIPPTGKGGTPTPHIDIWEYEGGKVKSLRTYIDICLVLISIGVIPVPELPPFVPSFALPDPEPSNLTTKELNLALQKRFSEHDLSAVAKMIHPDAEIKFPRVTLGRDEYIAMLEWLIKAFPDVRTDSQFISNIDLGDGWGISEFVLSGTHNGSYFDLVPPTGKPVSVRLVKLIHYDKDGLITYLASYQDELAILTQIGAFPPAETEINKAIVQRVFEEVWSKGNTDILGEIYTPDFVWHDPIAGDIIGIEGLKQSIDMYRSAFPDLHFIIEDQIAEGDKVLTRWTSYGTHLGTFMGIPPTGQKGPGLTGISIDRIENGKVKESWTFWDTLGMMQWLGVITPGREGPESYTWGAPSEVTGDPGTPEANKAILVRTIEEFWNKKNLNVMDETVSDKVLVHNPVIPGHPLSYEAYKQACLEFITAFPDMYCTIDNVIVEGDKLGHYWITTATHKAEFMGIPASGKKITLKGINSMRFADGKIVEVWWAYDFLGLIQQLTAQVPPDKETIREFGRRVYDDIWNKKDLSVVDELMVPEYTEYRPAGFITAGTTAYKQFTASHIAGFPDLNFELHDIIVEGNMSVVRWTVTGTHLGPFMGVPPDGRYGSGTTGIAIFRCEGNKLVEGWSEYDVLGLMGWLGLIPDRELQQWGEPSKVTGDPGDPETNKALIKRFTEEFFNQKKLETFDELVHPQVISHDPVISPTEDFATLREILGFAYPLAFPDIHSDINILVAEGDKVVARWTVTGTHKGEYFGIPPTGKSIKFTGITIYRIADGKIVEIWWSYDALGILQQIGVIPSGPPKDYTNVFFMALSPGLNMISLPLEPITPYTARSFAQEIGATVVIRYDTNLKKFIGFVPAVPGDGFDIKGGEGYIVNVPDGKVVAFTGAAWTGEPPVESAPPNLTDSAWAFVISGLIMDGEEMKIDSDRYTVVLKNLRTGKMLKEEVGSIGYFILADADLSRKPIIKAGDRVEITVMDSTGKIVSGPFVQEITIEEIKKALVSFQLRLGDIIPEKPALLQNYPNPFNPETWIPFQLSKAGEVTIRIYDSSGKLVRTFELGHKPAGIYISRAKACYWDGRNESGEKVASGVYFYSMTAGKFSDTRKMIIAK